MLSFLLFFYEIKNHTPGGMEIDKKGLFARLNPRR